MVTELLLFGLRYNIIIVVGDFQLIVHLIYNYLSGLFTLLSLIYIISAYLSASVRVSLVWLRKVCGRH